MKLNSKKIKIVLFLFILIVFGGIVAVFIDYKVHSSKPKMLISALQTKADLSIKKIHQTATRDGIKEWSLDAKTAHLIENEKTAIFDVLSITFFLENGEKAFLEADKGMLNTSTNDFIATGNVVLKNKDYVLKTDKLHYKHKRRIIYSIIPVQISGDTLNITAKSMFFNLNTKKTLLNGNVEGFFSDNFAL